MLSKEKDRAASNHHYVIVTNGNEVNPNSTAEIQTSSGDVLAVPLSSEGGREGSRLVIDGVPYHFERVSRKELLSRYKVDDDPDYAPKSDADGFCYILAPYSA